MANKRWLNPNPFFSFIASFAVLPAEHVLLQVPAAFSPLCQTQRLRGGGGEGGVIRTCDCSYSLHGVLRLQPFLLQRRRRLVEQSNNLLQSLRR